MEEPSVQPCFRHHRAGGFMALICACCFLLAPSAELLLSMQITSVTFWGTRLSPCALQGVEGPDPDPWVPPGPRPPRVRFVCLLWIPEAFRGFGSFSPMLSQLCFFHRHKIHSVTFVVVVVGFLVQV